MELRTLQYFLVVVEEENISRAAEKLHTTQPNLSRQIAQLEDEIGTQLFIRGKHLTLTDAGTRLKSRAEEVVSLLEKIEYEFQNTDELSGVINIGVGGQFAGSVLPDLVRDFSQKYPGVQFHFQTANARQIREFLDKGILDVGLLLEPVDTGRYNILRLSGQECWGLLVRRDNPLAGKEKIHKEDLVGIPLMFTGRTIIQRGLRDWFGDIYNQLHIVVTYDIVTNIAMLVENGTASALTIESAAHQLIGEQLTFIPLDPPVYNSSVLVWKRHNEMFGATERFISFLNDRIQ